jgi:hypothetical protein
VAEASPQNVPVTAVSAYPGSRVGTELAIGSNFFTNNLGTTAGYWFVAVDLTSLKVVQTITSTSNSEVPAAIQALAGNSQYFLFFFANNQLYYNVPQGALYSFLQAVGSGPQLTSLEQMLSQLPTGSILNFSYVLAATFTENDVPGFEASSPMNYAVLTMQFMPVNVGGNIIYAPVYVGSAG